MPAKSKKQYRFMQAVRGGDVPGVPPSVGEDFVGGQSPAGLPESAPEKKKKRKPPSDKGKMPPAIRDTGGRRKGW